MCSIPTATMWRSATSPGFTNNVCAAHAPSRRADTPDWCIPPLGSCAASRFTADGCRLCCSTPELSAIPKLARNGLLGDHPRGPRSQLLASVAPNHLLHNGNPQVSVRRQFQAASTKVKPTLQFRHGGCLLSLNVAATQQTAGPQVNDLFSCISAILPIERKANWVRVGSVFLVSDCAIRG